MKVLCALALFVLLPLAAVNAHASTINVTFTGTVAGGGPTISFTYTDTSSDLGTGFITTTWNTCSFSNGTLCTLLEFIPGNFLPGLPQIPANLADRISVNTETTPRVDFYFPLFSQGTDGTYLSVAASPNVGTFERDTVADAEVPEPTSLVLLSSGLLGIIGMARGRISAE
jgi:hypothetical protein